MRKHYIRILPGDKVKVELSPTTSAAVGSPTVIGRQARKPDESPSSVKPMCERCRVIKRHGTTMVICIKPRHKQRQG